MKIGIGGYYLGQSGIGLGVYTAQLVWALSQVDRDNRYTVFSPGGADPAPGPLPGNFDLRRHRGVPLGNQWLQRAAWESTLSLKARRCGLDVFHAPYFSFLPVPKAKTVVTVHDMALSRYPVYRGRFVGRIYFGRIERAVAKADHVITDSEFSKREITEVLGIDARKISVFPLAVPASFAPVGDSEDLERVRKAYGLPDRYILYLGGFDVRKNIGALVRAYASLRKEKKTAHKLVLGGTVPTDPRLLKRGAFTDVLRQILELEIGPDVCLPGFIEAEDLPAVYSAADLFVYPSLYEGFGLPVLEAMSCGTAVLACGRSSLPEIVNREDLLFDPADEESLKRAIRSLLSDEPGRMEVSEWGLARARDYTWEKTARETLRVYEGLSGG
jgi:glycosyltransferase involved in cell wall biosynthesis